MVLRVFCPARQCFEIADFGRGGIARASGASRRRLRFMRRSDGRCRQKYEASRVAIVAKKHVFYLAGRLYVFVV